ncbi:MAG: hypothetical protein AB9866_18810 [Syntrophobacteraceae bacterium]
MSEFFWIGYALLGFGLPLFFAIVFGIANFYFLFQMRAKFVEDFEFHLSNGTYEDYVSELQVEKPIEKIPHGVLVVSFIVSLLSVVVLVVGTLVIFFTGVEHESSAHIFAGVFGIIETFSLIPIVAMMNDTEVTKFRNEYLDAISRGKFELFISQLKLDQERAVKTFQSIKGANGK